MAGLSWQERDASERRWDGPIPCWETPGDDPVTDLRRRMRLQRRLAADYVREARHQLERSRVADVRDRARCEGNARRSLCNLAEARRTHTMLAGALRALRAPAPPPLSGSRG